MGPVACLIRPTLLYALPPMQAAGYGRIVNVSSEAGLIGSKRGSVFAAAKAGVIAFTKAIARENARYGITANSILPGPIETAMLQVNRERPRGYEVVAADGRRYFAAANRRARGGGGRGDVPRCLHLRRDARVSGGSAFGG